MRLFSTISGGPPSGRTAAARLAAIAGLLALSLLLTGPGAAFGQDESDATPSADDGEMAAQGAADELLGVFTVTITRGDLPIGLAGGPSLLGQWSLSLEDDGTYSFQRQDVGVVASGAFEVDGERVTLTEETGLLPCIATGADGGDAAAEASYRWELDDDALTLTPIEEGCRNRQILLATRALGGFEACATLAVALTDRDGEDAGTPAADDAADRASQGVTQQEDAPSGGDAEGAIDTLLRQATGCWATGDPARFLPLHTRRVFDDIIERGPLTDFQASLIPIMQQPLSFERVGEIELEDDNRASAYVVIRFAGEEIPQRFEFALEDGEWLLDTFFIFELLGGS